MPTSKKDTKTLTKLGRRTRGTRKIETFPNHAPGEIEVTFHCNEFTCMCPVTKQPDYAQIEIIYEPDKYVAESKSLKLYLESYRNVGIFHEHLAVDIGRDFMKWVKPNAVDVTVHFNARGGIAISATWSGSK